MDIMTRHQPDGWKLRSLGQVFAERKEKGSDRDFPALSVTMNGIVPQLETAAKTDRGDDRKVVRVGDYVINSRSDRKGSGGISDLEGSVSLISIVMKPTDIEPKFAHHLLRSVAFQEEFYRFGRGIVADLWSTRYDDLKRIQVYLPPRDQQNRIASDLDRETARIDALIEKKTRFIELLKEKRQALITQAVTKGLDPTVPMKDSGVEWIGEVPAHWDVRRVKHAARMESGHTPDKKNEAYWVDCDIPWVSLKDSAQLRTTDYISETATYINQAGLAGSSARMLPKGTVVFTRDATVGLVAIASCELAVSQHLVAWVPTGEALPEYLLNTFEAMTQGLESLMAGSTIKTIGMDDIKDLMMPVPPPDEQEEIARHIAKEKARSDKTVALCERSVELLKERRSALITAAVTGQIDLREDAA